MAKKLRLAAEHRAAIVNAPAGYLAQLTPGPADMTTDLQPNQTYDAVVLFVKDVEQLRRLGPAAIRAAKANGLLWITYPKGGQSGGVTDLPATPRLILRERLGVLSPSPGFQPAAAAP